MTTPKDTLHLTLHKKAFEVMVTGEKDREYRKPTAWIKSRLFHKNGVKKEYKYIQFKNGYSKDAPCFTAELQEWWYAVGGVKREYSNGLKVQIEKDDIVFGLGEIIETRKLNKTL